MTEGYDWPMSNKDFRVVHFLDSTNTFNETCYSGWFCL